MTGREYVCASADGGKGRSFSVNTQTGAWADFGGTDKGGDAVSLAACVRRCNQGEAAKWLQCRIGMTAAIPPPTKPTAKPSEWVCVPCPTPPPPLPGRVSGKPRTGAWPYHHADGSIAGYAVRGEDGEGKSVLPLTWCRSAAGVEQWRFAAMPEPRPLYGLPDLMARQAAPVLVVEGEKTADAARNLFPHMVVTTWAGGCKAMAKTDLSPLSGRDVIYWPDADAPGKAAADEFAGRVPHARIVSLPDGLPDGWDIADPLPEGWDLSAVSEFVASACRATPEPIEHHVPEYADYSTPSGPDPSEIAAELAGMEPLTAMQKLILRLPAVRFDPARPPPEEPWLFKLAGVEIAHPGNLLVVAAAVKSGKSSFKSAMLASLFGNPGRDYLGVEGRNTDGKAVLHFDTEQSKGDHHHMMVRSVERAGATACPDWMESYSLRSFSRIECRAVIVGLVKEKALKGGVHSVFIDGVADLCSDVNDMNEASDLVSELMRLADETASIIVCGLHHNPGSEKTRGHLGSEIERKAESVITLKKVEEKVTVTVSPARHAPVGKDNGVTFEWNDSERRHTLCGYVAPVSRANEDLRSVVEELFADIDPGRGMPWLVMKDKIVRLRGWTPKTAESKIYAMTKQKLIVKNTNQSYSRCAQ